MGAFISLMSLIGGLLNYSNALFGVGSIIILPITYGLGGAIGGAIRGFIYNIVASTVGGIEIETE